MDNIIDTKKGGGMIYMTTLVALHENMLNVIKTVWKVSVWKV